MDFNTITVNIIFSLDELAKIKGLIEIAQAQNEGVSIKFSPVIKKIDAATQRAAKKYTNRLILQIPPFKTAFAIEAESEIIKELNNGN